jgi:hypothetical protein
MVILLKYKTIWWPQEVRSVSSDLMTTAAAYNFVWMAFHIEFVSMITCSVWKLSYAK